METRRSILKRGLLGSALLLLGGGTGLAFRRSRLVELPSEGLLVLGAREFAVLDAVSRRLITPQPGFPSVDEVRVAFGCDRLLAMTDETSQVELRQLLELFESALGGLLFGGRVTPFTQLSAEEQDQVLHEWMTSRVAIRRTGYLALRTLIHGVYYSSPKAWSAVGYSGPPSAFHDPNAPVWKGGGAPRPPSPGIWVEPT
jgi:hypothetical protein